MDSAPMPLEGQSKKWVRLDNTLTVGSLCQILLILVGGLLWFSGGEADKARQKAEMDALKAAALTERANTKEALTDLKADVKELQKGTNEIKEGLAILRGRGIEGRTK